MLAELLRHPLAPWIATYLAHSTILCAAAWGFDLWSRRRPARERTLGPARERLWKLALFLPLASTLLQCAGGISFWQLPEELRAAPLASVPLLEKLVSAPAAAPSLVQAPAAPGLPFRIGWEQAAAALWIAGVLFGAFLWWREWHALGRAVRGIAPCTDAELQAEFDALRAGDRALVGARLFIGRHVLVPLTLGWTRMRVVVPERAAFELDGDERRAMLAHELAHARRRDPLWISAARVVEGLLFFQPLNRLARIRMQDEAEFLADRWAIERGVEALSLASCLTEVAGWIVSHRRALPVPSMAARGARLTRRVERLLEERRAPLPLRTAPWSLGFLALALGTAAAAVPGRAERAVQRQELREPAVLQAASAAAPDDLASDLELLAAELESLALQSEERELDERWNERLCALRMRLETLQNTYARLQELAQESTSPAEAETQPDTEP